MKYRGMLKIRCSCGYEGFHYHYGDKLCCPECEENGTHGDIELIPLNEWSCDEICDIWVSELEDENEHSLTSAPNNILRILSKNIKDKELIKNILIDLYQTGLK